MFQIYSKKMFSIKKTVFYQKFMYFLNLKIIFILKNINLFLKTITNKLLISLFHILG